MDYKIKASTKDRKTLLESLINKTVPIMKKYNLESFYI